MTDWQLTLWLASYVAVFLGLSLFGAHRLRILWLYRRHRGPDAAPQKTFQELPVVTVQLPIFNEVTVAGRLIDSVAQLNYPKDRLQIQVLDDSTDETRELCEEHAEE